MTPQQIISKKNDSPILIVDRVGIIGESLTNKLKDEATIVFVSEKPLDLENTIHIQFGKKFPAIPDNTYSHIFVVDDRSSIRDFLPNFLEKAKNDRAGFVFITSVLEESAELIDEVTNLKGKIVFFGDVFPKNLFLGEFNISIVNKFINQARMRGRIDIPGDGTSVTYPVFFDDLITGILESAFGNHEEKVFYLFPKHGVTYLTLAHMIQKANPNITIDFTLEDVVRSAGLPNVGQGKYLLSDKYNPQARIKKLDLEISNTLEDQKNGQLKMRAERSLSFPFKIFIFCFLFLLFLPLITTIFFSFLGFQSLATLKTYLQKNEIDKAQKSANFAKTYFDLANLTSTPFLFEANFIGQGEKIEKLKDKIIQGQTISLGGIYFFNALKSNNLNSLKNALIIFQKEPESAKYFGPDESLIKFASNTMSVWPQIAGFDEKKTYLILFQDKSELRPTGGLIDSYGILKVVNGKVSNFKEYDVSDSDRKLTGHVEPPFAIRRYLPSPNWYLKDSNFNVDFPKAASASAFFLNIETGEAVDGVIGVVSSKDLKSYFAKDTTFLGLLRVLTKSINDKKVLFAFSDKNLQNLFSINGWSSSIREEKKNPDNQIADFLGINEANLGKNKTNTSVKRKVVQNTAIDEKGSISEDVLISFQNEGLKDYKNYLRIILPLGSNLEKIEINNEKQDLSNAIINPEIYEASNFVPGKGLEIEKYNQDEKTIYGFLITVAKKDSKTIKINYTLSRKIIFPTLDFSYALYVFKQPGVDSYPHDFSLKVPESFRIVGSQKPEFQKMVSNDFDITFNFAQR